MICSAECTRHQSIIYFECHSSNCLFLCFNPQDCLWEHGSFAQHVFVPVRPAAPDSPDSDSEAHYEHHCPTRAQPQYGAHIFHRGTNDSDDQY